MTSTATLILSFLAGGIAADTSRDSRPGVDPDRARELVKLLADAKFKVRDAAEKELLDLGLAALDALKEGEKHPDLHVQDRCRALQPTIRGMTLRKRIDAFLSSRDGTLPKDLPFVAKFIKITGDSKEARGLYVDILQENAQMLETAQRDKKKGAEDFVAYCQEITLRMRYVQGADFQARQRSITRTDLATFFLMSRELSGDTSGRNVGIGSTFLNGPVLAETLAKDTPAAVPFKKVFLNWLESETQSYMMQRGLQVAVEAKMKEAMPLVLKQIKQKSSPAYTRGQTALLLAKIGAKENLPDVEALLDDKSVVGNVGINNVQGQVQLRDIALAVCIKLSGQKMTDYDFDVMKGNEELIHSSYIYCAFSSDAKREAAHKKYQDSRASQATK